MIVCLFVGFGESDWESEAEIDDFAHEDVEIDDLEHEEGSTVYAYKCRCGVTLQWTKEQLAERKSYYCCSGCSHRVHVVVPP